MENWTALKKGNLMMEIFLAEHNLDQECSTFWDQIKINPSIWKCEDVIEDNFWAVAKHQNYVVWYNDIEEGFNISIYKTEGIILKYSAFKDDLNQALNKLIHLK